MPRRNDDMPSVATYADHEVITPPHKLRKAVGSIMDPSDNPIARAEAALAQLSSEFATWMHSECERLDATRQDVMRQGFNDKTREALHRAAHDSTSMPCAPLFAIIPALTWRTLRAPFRSACATSPTTS
jgi:hypothetical protein